LTKKLFGGGFLAPFFLPIVQLYINNMKPVLVLDSSFRPIKQISWQKAMTMYFQEKIEIIREYEDTWVNSPRKKFKLPAVIRLINYVFKLPWGVKLTRTNLFVRDRGCCQYCDKRLSKSRFTVDHVIPKSKGGKTDWKNLVVSCAKCNTKKGDSLLHETNLKLGKSPIQPKNNFFMIIPEETPSDWIDFLIYQ
jgi:5-methylcytosine-specific restriction endonuclease McrA|tara:strand:+ start:7046 stop:7624 length:579 start_codon:yes stop_codon:yes gene_type:complete